MNKKFQARQGDILIFSVDSLPKKAKKKNDLVILYGEATGHAHRLEAGDIYTLNDELYLVLGKDSRIVHEEHNPIELVKGVYGIKRQREYITADMTRLVID